MKSNTKKRLIAFMLCMVLVLSSATSAFADELDTQSQDQTTTMAEPETQAAVADEPVVTSLDDSTDEQQPVAEAEENQEQAVETPSENTEEATPEVAAPATETAEEPQAEAPVANEEVKAEEPASEESQPILQLTYEDDNVKVTVDAVDAGNIPDGASLSVTPIIKKEITDSMSDKEKEEAKEMNDHYDHTEKKLQEKAKDEPYEIAGFLAYDITFLDADGNKLEPNGDVKVSMEYKKAEIPEEAKKVQEKNEDQKLDVTVMHLEEDEKGEVKEVVDMVADENETATVETTDNKEVKKAEFVTDSFSDYVISWGRYNNTITDITGQTHISENQYKSYLATMKNKVEGTDNGNLPITDWKRSSSYKNADIDLTTTSQSVNDSSTNQSWWETVSKLTTNVTDQSEVWDGSRKSTHNFTNYLDNNYLTVYNNTLYDSATWKDHHDDDKKNIKDGTFYRFQGTFNIGTENPNNYSYTIQQVTGNDKLYINDDMWVFVYPEGTTLNANNYMDYLAFWTGTRNQNQTNPKWFNDRQGTLASQDSSENLKVLTDGWNMPAAIDNAGAIIQSVYNSGNHATKYVIDVFVDDYAAGGGMYRLTVNKQQTQKTPIEFTKTTLSGTALAGATFAIEDSTHSVYYTATSGSDGKVRFSLLDGTYTLKETKAPDGYLKSNDTWTVTVKNGSYTITKDGEPISKPYTISNRSEHEEALAGLESSKTVEITDYSKREYQINLSASTTGKSADEEAQAASVILVLDESSSMTDYPKSLSDIKTAAISFVNTLRNASPKSEIAVSWYRGSEDGGTNYTVTDGNFINVESENNYNNIIEQINAGETSDNQSGTPMGKALEKAYKKLSSANYSNKYVILFTDGMPGYWSDNNKLNCNVANNAYTNATNIKKTATLFTVGYSLDGSFSWNPGDSNSHKNHITTSATDFLEKYIATAATNGKQYAYTTDNSAGLQETFENLAGSIGSLYSIQPNKIVDVIDSRFELTKAQKEEFDAYNKAHEFETPVNKIEYKENTDGTTTITWYGKAAFIGNKEATDPTKGPWSATVDIVAKSDFIGGNTIPTNGAASGIYVDDNTTKLFPQPSVNVRLFTPSIDSKEITFYKGEEITSSTFTKELLDSYKLTGDLEQTVTLKLGQHGIPELTTEEINSLKPNQPITRAYSYPGTEDVVGTFKFEFTPDEKGTVGNHTATITGNAVETYTLKVTFIPKTREERQNILAGKSILSPQGETKTITDSKLGEMKDIPKGSYVVTEVEKEGTYIVNVFAIYKQSTSINPTTKAHPKLAGAKFSLTGTKNNVYYGLSDDNGLVKWYSDKDCTKSLLFNDWETDTYTFKELQAPAGYSLNTKTWKIEKQVDEPTVISKVVITNFDDTDNHENYYFNNTPLYNLPSTGGSGIYLYMIGGILLMFAAAWILYKNKCREVLER